MFRLGGPEIDRMLALPPQAPHQRRGPGPCGRTRRDWPLRRRQNSGVARLSVISVRSVSARVGHGAAEQAQQGLAVVVGCTAVAPGVPARHAPLYHNDLAALG